MKSLTSESNPQYRRWLKLATAPRAVRELGLSLAEGLHLAQAAVDAGARIEAVIHRRGSRGPQLDALLAQLGSVPRFELTASMYDRLALVEHGSGLTLVVPVPAVAAPAAAPLDLVYLDGIQDPVNVGALLRNAAAAGISHVLCGPTCATAWAPRALRAAMGAHFRLKVSEGVSPESLRPSLDGIWIAAVVRDATSLWSCPLPDSAIGWAFGSEGAGLSAATLAQCTQRLCIPMDRDSESLNVAAAAAVCLFERSRRRRATS